MSKVCVEVEPSSEVAVTSTRIASPDSKSRAEGSATLITPLCASIAKAPSGFMLRL